MIIIRNYYFKIDNLQSYFDEEYQDVLKNQS